MMRAVFLALAAGLVAAVLSSPAASQTTPPTETKAPATKAPAVKAPPCPPGEADGDMLFACQNCILCHIIEGNKASGGKGNIKGPLMGVGAKLKPEEIREWLMDPVGMRKKTLATREPAMIKKKMTEPQIDALVKYLSSLKK